VRILQLELTNFLSYRSAVIDLSGFTALIGQNAAGKSNLVTAIRLLSEIPQFGLSTAIARRGGFDQLRHRSRGRPNDPALRLTFQLEDGLEESEYELRLRSIPGKRYEVKLEHVVIHDTEGVHTFTNKRGQLTSSTTSEDASIAGGLELPPFPPDQSALSAFISRGGFIVWQLLSALQTVDINPAAMRELQDPTGSLVFNPDGSSAASVLQGLDADQRTMLAEQLAAVVPGITGVEPRNVADKITIHFRQDVEGKNREFSARQMSDGTLRVLGILLALSRPRHGVMTVIEEPEVAVHLAAQRTLIEILSEYTNDTQVLITTHSADVIDALPIDDLRVVWSEAGRSLIAPVAKYTADIVREGLITPGELLRSGGLDPLTQ